MISKCCYDIILFLELYPNIDVINNTVTEIYLYSNSEYRGKTFDYTIRN